MIKVFFPEGCYGTYVSRCIYHYTNLRIGPFEDFIFGHAGNSHQHRQDYQSKLAIDQGHTNTLSYVDTDQLVVIVPNEHNRLDYYNNQFLKHHNGELIEWVLSHVLEDEIDHKFFSQWNYSGKFDKTTPRWIVREWCSFWLNDHLKNRYDKTKYCELKSVVQLSTQDIFENWTETLTHTVSTLGLTFTVDTDTIQKQHTKFLMLQHTHNSQQKCHQYVNDTLVGNNTPMIINTIFDEAYIQYLLRQHNFEIQCNGLDIFPDTTQQLKNLTYEAMHHTNT